jgi:heat shock protein HslJ
MHQLSYKIKVFLKMICTGRRPPAKVNHLRRTHPPSQGGRMHSTRKQHSRYSFLLLLWAIVLLPACTASHRLNNPAANDLRGTTWVLRSIQSMADELPTITIQQPKRYLLHFQEDGRLILRLDCNRGTGSWQATPGPSSNSGQLTLGPIATTRMFCPPPSLGDRVGRDLGFVRSYILRDGRLYLSLMADGGIYEWQPATVRDLSTTLE